MFDNVRLPFFRGLVHFERQSLLSAQYMLESNGSIIKVGNSGHFRLLGRNQIPFPPFFEIMAPMKAVKVVEGNIPESYIKVLPVSEYNRIRSMY